MESLRCPTCGKENPAGARFCGGCGASLTAPSKSSCPQCGQPVTGADNFCFACGANLKSRPEKADVHKLPKSAPWVALGLVAAGLIFIFVFVSSQSKPPASSAPGSADAPTQAALPQLTEAEVAKLPKDFGKLVEQGNHYFDHQQFHDAMTLYRKALEIDSTASDVRTDYAACLNFLGDFEAAKKQLEKVLAGNPNHAVATFNLGVVWLNLGDHQKAREFWNKYLTLDPASPRADQVKKMLSQLK